MRIDRSSGPIAARVSLSFCHCGTERRERRRRSKIKSAGESHLQARARVVVVAMFPEAQQQHRAIWRLMQRERERHFRYLKSRTRAQARDGRDIIMCRHEARFFFRDCGGKKRFLRIEIECWDTEERYARLADFYSSNLLSGNCR